MKDLLWLHGITWDTPLRDIGWTYVVLIMLGGVLTVLIKKLIRDCKGD